MLRSWIPGDFRYGFRVGITDSGRLVAGYSYPWGSAHVLAPLILGIVCMIAFTLWEMYGAKHPMFPKRLRHEPRVLALTLVITFISGYAFPPSP